MNVLLVLSGFKTIRSLPIIKRYSFVSNTLSNLCMYCRACIRKQESRYFTWQSLFCFYHLQRPSLRRGKTAIISNERGHLNTSGHRSTTSPWGTFVGTWQMERKPIELKTKTKLLTYAAQSGMSVPGSRQSSRASSAHPTSEHSNNSRNEEIINSDLNEGNVRTPTPNSGKPMSPGQESRASNQTPLPDIEQRNVVSPTGSQANSRPATVSSMRSSAQGSRVQSPLEPIKSPTPLGGSRAVSVSTRSASIVSNRPPSVDLHTSNTPPPGSEASMPQSPPGSRVDSRLQTSGHCSPTQPPETSKQDPI